MGAALANEFDRALDDLLRPYAPPARDEFLLAATAQYLRKLAKLIPPPTPAIA